MPFFAHQKEANKRMNINQKRARKWKSGGMILTSNLLWLDFSMNDIGFVLLQKGFRDFIKKSITFLSFVFGR